MSDKPEGGYEKLLFCLFALGAGILALVTLFILYDVIARNTGFPPFTHTLALTEYGLYYVTLLGAPWLVRKKHHVYMQLVTAVAPAALRPRYLQAQLPAVRGCLRADLLLTPAW